MVTLIRVSSLATKVLSESQRENKSTTKATRTTRTNRERRFLVRRELVELVSSGLVRLIDRRRPSTVALFPPASDLQLNLTLFDRDDRWSPTELVLRLDDRLEVQSERVDVRENLPVVLSCSLENLETEGSRTRRRSSCAPALTRIFSSTGVSSLLSISSKARLRAS